MKSLTLALAVTSALLLLASVVALTQLFRKIQEVMAKAEEPISTTKSSQEFLIMH